MTEQAEKPNATFFHRETSETAANAHDRKFGPSGKMAYAVTIAGGMGMIVENFDAHSGDDAAALALQKYVGAKVAHVEPAPQRKKAA